MRNIFLPLCFCGLTILFACGENSNEFSSVACFVQVDNRDHNNSTLASAMNPMAPGVFCLVQSTQQGGALYFGFKNNQGSQSSSIFNGKDQRMTFIFGYNNGVIVGFGNLDSPAVFYAYDYQCPNCFDWQTIPRKNYPLSMSADGTAACNVCKRVYNMNTGGNIVKGDGGNKLTRYRASTTGPLGILNVH